MYQQQILEKLMADFPPEALPVMIFVVDPGHRQVGVAYSKKWLQWFKSEFPDAFEKFCESSRDLLEQTLAKAQGDG